MKKLKVERMNLINELESFILELEQWEVGGKLSSKLEYTIGSIFDLKQRDAKIDFIKKNILVMRETLPDDHKLYLSEIIAIEKPEFLSNNLILSPVGSGKSTLIKDILVKGKIGKILVLVSNTTLKEHVCPEDLNEREIKGHRMFTSKDITKFGDQGYDIHVMTYSEFGNRIKYNDDFIKDIVQIHCDEIHSLPEYQGFKDSAGLSHALKFLFNKYDDKQIFYFTATDENLILLKKKQKDILRNVVTFDYRNHPDIKQYMVLSEYKISNVEQIRPHLRARLRSFNYFKYKGLAFSRTIAGQKIIEEIAIEEGFKPISLWSVNNESNLMDEIKIKAREELINTGFIPEPYNLLIINSAMQEGWDLIDDKVKLAIMNTTNETEKIQALGRIRNDIDVLVYKSTEQTELPINLPSKYINVPLTTYKKNVLCEELNLYNSIGKLMKWTAIKILLTKQGYNIEDTEKRIDGERCRVSIITES